MVQYGNKYLLEDSDTINGSDVKPTRVNDFDRFRLCVNGPSI